MRSIFGLLYSVIFMGFVLTGFFILFHISRYALNRRVAAIAATLFILVTAVLLFTNALLFFHLPFESFFLTSSTFGS